MCLRQDGKGKDSVAKQVYMQAKESQEWRDRAVWTGRDKERRGMSGADLYPVKKRKPAAIE
jgi:hypothetical protein